MRVTQALLSFAAGLACSAAPALAQTSCLRNVGPDVIVGDLTGPTNYTAAGGYDAFSIGTTSCNVGNVWLNWISNTNQHPVIGQNLFKLKTRTVGSASYQTFEHLGQSWLKHGFFALSQNLCCSGCQSTNGSYLGISCSDPYTSSRNGTQSNLGPKWQVNAYTGNFTYPPANPSFINSSNVARRLIVSLTDLEPSSATVSYFVEGQYVTPDDAAAGNQANNASYRRASISGGPTNYTMSLTGQTVREMPAIEAWRTADPSISLYTASDTGDGLFYVASKATDLGNGTWHYEYAVYNMYSDRNGGTFTVPLPDSAVVSNVEFRSVSYHDGDGMNSVNFDNAPWTTQRANNAFTWSTKPMSVSQNANALRWGTLFNFRFDADVAPDLSGSAQIGLWKTPNTSLSVTAQVPEVTGSCYANCDGSTAPPILNVADFSCFLAKFAANDPYANCDESTSPPVLNVADFSCFLAQFAAGCR
jgi:hypothetical protein